MDLYKPNYPLSILVLLVFLAILVHSTLPAFFFMVDSKRSAGTVLDLNDHHLDYRYRNAFDGATYSVSRYVSVPAYQTLRATGHLTVWYPRYFPEAALVEEIDYRPMLVLPALFILLAVWALWDCGKQLRTPTS